MRIVPGFSSLSIWPCIAALASAALAAVVAAMPAVASEDQRGLDESSPYIAETRVIAPRRVGEFVLEGSRFDPRSKAAGVSLRYLDPAHPQVRIDLFVYPAGDTSAEDALAHGMREFRASLEEAVRLKYYSELEIAEPENFEIAPTQTAPAATQDHDAHKHDGHDDLHDVLYDEPLPAEIAAMLQSRPLRGRKIVLGYRGNAPESPEGIPMRSRGYLFYKQLYFFKGRISAAESQIGEAEFSALADRAMRMLVPAIEAAHRGRCANIVLEFDPDERDEDKRQQTIAEALLSAMAGQNEKNCVAEFDETRFAAAHADDEVVKIEYSADDWRQR